MEEYNADLEHMIEDEVNDIIPIVPEIPLLLQYKQGHGQVRT